jgi:RHS repeat-associated protein
VLDETGVLLSSQRFLPFGAVRGDAGSVSETDFGYTGQREYASIDLLDYHARWHAPSLGRFVQADTLVPDPFDPQSLNRYSYVLNNPLKYVDPSGHKFVEDIPSGAPPSPPPPPPPVTPTPNVSNPTPTSTTLPDFTPTPTPPLIIPEDIRQYDENGEIDFKASWKTLENKPAELIARVIFSEEGAKLFTEYEDDCYGVAWAVRNRYYNKDFHDYDWRIAATSEVHGMRHPKALSPLDSPFAKNFFGDEAEIILAYNRALEIAIEVLSADQSEDITNGALFWSDAYYTEDGTTAPYNRTHFKKTPYTDQGNWCVTTVLPEDCN